MQVHFFAHLTIARVIPASSMLALLQSFTAVLDEFGVSHSRAKNAALCAAEGLMRVNDFLYHLLQISHRCVFLGWVRTKTTFGLRCFSNHNCCPGVCRTIIWDETIGFAFCKIVLPGGRF